MGKLVMIVTILALAYWYWSGPYRQSGPNRERDDPEKNAEIMARCIAHERRMRAAGGMAGLADVGSSGDDAERLCAAEYGFRLEDGEWHRQSGAN